MKTKKQKSHRLNFRVSEETFQKLQALSKILELNHTKSFEASIDYILNSILEIHGKQKIQSKHGKKAATDS